MYRIAVLLAAVASLGCRSAPPHAEVTSAVELTPRVVGPGDTVRVRVIATNRGRHAVPAGVRCGAGLDFEVVEPDGTRRLPVRDLPADCPLMDSNVLDPGETDTVVYRWAVPAARGTYRVRGGLKARSGLAAPSPSTSFEVR